MRRRWRYFKRFFVSFFTEGFAWGRDNLAIAGVIAVLAITFQLVTNQLKPAEVLKQSWPIVYVYGGLFLFYVVVQLAITAAKLDEDRENAIGLPLLTRAYFGTPDEMLTLEVGNGGPRGHFSAEVLMVMNVRNSESIEVPFPVKWKDVTSLVNVIEIPGGGTRFIQVASVSHSANDHQEGPPTVLMTVFGATRENQAQLSQRGTLIDPATIVIEMRSDENPAISKRIGLRIFCAVDGRFLQRNVGFEPSN